MARAWTLRGWRWTHKYNAKEVAYLRSVLGHKVDGYADKEAECPRPTDLMGDLDD